MQNERISWNGERFWIWFIKIVSGLIIVLFLGLHFIINHLVAPEGLLNYADVLEYYSNPIIPIIEILFLVTVVPHALIGIRGIMLDLNPKPVLVNVINIALLACGISAIIYGIWLIIVIVNRITPG